MKRGSRWHKCMLEMEHKNVLLERRRKNND